MDNKAWSVIKRALKVTTSYLLTLIVFAVFSVIVLSFGENTIATAMTVFSFLLFLLLFYTAYVDMRVIAFKEKRPQYNINPSPFKGLLYGFIGSLPVLIIQILTLVIKIPGLPPEALLMRRILQAVSGPLYWFARLIGNAPVSYMLSLLLVVLIAGLGYYAGYYDFYLVARIRKRLGLEPKKKKVVKKR